MSDPSNPFSTSQSQQAGNERQFGTEISSTAINQPSTNLPPSKDQAGLNLPAGTLQQPAAPGALPGEQAGIGATFSSTIAGQMPDVGEHAKSIGTKLLDAAGAGIEAASTLVEKGAHAVGEFLYETEERVRERLHGAPAPAEKAGEIVGNVAGNVAQAGAQLGTELKRGAEQISGSVPESASATVEQPPQKILKAGEVIVEKLSEGVKYVKETVAEKLHEIQEHVGGAQPQTTGEKVATTAAATGAGLLAASALKPKSGDSSGSTVGTAIGTAAAAVAGAAAASAAVEGSEAVLAKQRASSQEQITDAQPLSDQPPLQMEGSITAEKPARSTRSKAKQA